MDSQNSNQSAAANDNHEAATTNGGNATQEVSSTTEAPEVLATPEAPEPTKRSLRVQTWKKMKENKFGAPLLTLFNRIPGFEGSEKAGELLAETEEFNKANNIKVFIDRPLNAAKLQTLLAGKNLYLPSTRTSQALYFKVDVPDDATGAQKAKILNTQNVEKHRTEISLEDKVELDLVIIGSVVVSRDGYRIGRGNGFNDLDIGLLCEVGSITDKTIIATMVHDAQVVDSLPTNLFKKYDAPIDLIVTPTQVIRVNKRLARPTGIFWELLSERRLSMIPVLQELKDTQENAGKIIVLKEEDTDIEEYQRIHRRRFIERRRNAFRRYKRRLDEQDYNENQKPKKGGENQQQKRNPPQRKRFTNRRRRQNKSESEQPGEKSKSKERKSDGESGDKKPKTRRNLLTRDFTIKLSNISRDVRIRDLKKELRNRQCKPISITWKGRIGRCYLHFGRLKDQPSNEEDKNKVLEALNDFSMVITKTKHKNKSTTNGEGDVTTDDGATGDGTTGDGTTGDGTTGDGTTGDGTTGDGTTGDGTTGDGTTGDGTTGDGTTGDGTTGDGATGDGATGDVITGDANADDGTVGYGITGNDGKQQEKETEEEVVISRVVKVKVELVKRMTKEEKHPPEPYHVAKCADELATTTADDGDTSARIESVDTTTV